MLFPKKVKYRKWQSRRNMRDKRHPETRGTDLSFGSYGLKTDEYARITSNQIEAARKTITRRIKKAGKMWIRIFPDRPFTQKGAETPMGSGKGDPKGYVAQVHSGRVLFEMDGTTEEIAKEALREAGTKLPVKTRFVTREIV
ncbi:MAG: 50S ribosomal protein L16 [Candidatus Vogelbacteria bacterium CG10_big_fil_rev_8_21_14_0_10_45_14]|uniref:Large ribosomal subunit protein uL16 n=1 Tax=Candidatus Vogelbacteria bacterium CG10_big_fil_rev_8_21_14_0_10_45_14 TaxID=1975042 RepID=A0A2H0RKV5_9BACT|nr:MAG: 50S ribosomal protein L16 [Candidatus Vogelbacteria bacterium CG10_big_fil_rev_8_21_14_0_10_45_14]